MSRYADILIAKRIPSLPALLTYEVGEATTLAVGDGVAVEMGANATHFYTGIVWRLHDERPPYERVRPILKKLYAEPLISPRQMKFWEWIAEYYLCSLNDVMRVALPSLIQPVEREAEAFSGAEYTPSQEYYIERQEGSDTTKLRGRQREAYDEIEALLASRHAAVKELPRRLLNCDLEPLKALARKGVIRLEKRDRRVEQTGNISFQTPTLTPHQAMAAEDIREGHTTHLCALLHGVTGSGKTEVYIDRIGEVIAAGGDVLFLLPEIALTTQLEERMKRVFGSRVLTLHSLIPARRRTEIFMHLSRSHEGGHLILGARSAIFAPLNRLGLIVVDEEHDASYKQSESAPLYNARDAAHILASIYGAKVILGSATPSLESWTNAMTGKFAMASLTERYGEAELPKIMISDTRRAVRRHERVGHLNIDTKQHIDSRLARGEQVMLFQNRRGISPYIECSACGWVARCPHCNVSLTLHRSGMLRCHYCEYSTPTPPLCPSCGGDDLQGRGFGTEKIEEQIASTFPTARVVRMDRDTATSPTALRRIVDSFSRGESDVMVGTQMIAKGFDFERVTMVGILNADNLLLNPDFRAEERAFALMMQVAGRAGRRHDGGAEVVIQSSQPDHRIIRFVEQGDYETMARTLLEERERYFYPPYARITTITLRHADRERLYSAANALSALLCGRFGRRVRGPVPPPIDRIRGEWLVSFVLKVESGASSQRARDVLRECFATWRASVVAKGVMLHCNVDPQ